MTLDVTARESMSLTSTEPRMSTVSILLVNPTGASRTAAYAFLSALFPSRRRASLRSRSRTDHLCGAGAQVNLPANISQKTGTGVGLAPYHSYDDRRWTIFHLWLRDYSAGVMGSLTVTNGGSLRHSSFDFYFLPLFPLLVVLGWSLELSLELHSRLPETLASRKPSSFRRSCIYDQYLFRLSSSIPLLTSWKWC